MEQHSASRRDRAWSPPQTQKSSIVAEPSLAVGISGRGEAESMSVGAVLLVTMLDGVCRLHDPPCAASGRTEAALDVRPAPESYRLRG